MAAAVGVDMDGGAHVRGVDHTTSRRRGHRVAAALRRQLRRTVVAVPAATARDPRLVARVVTLLRRKKAPWRRKTEGLLHVQTTV